ncbi:hypothetical protein WKR88_02955 [Trinickia caryophylli]|uniref:Uncharacterized protein n=1 Tax=Trinickia caryophylli TaxID=28094 RepID=A0A1X7FUI3_TRICW|nr:hypothetical protein [Trinickia caryophylli]PMS11920.1 hypothetical protein C0Z17_12010 [Trinickia caryophylli]TRX14002.1 hypothetical protein FNF07_21895 [Trinickia caryophylli]WQE15601.1 hypothetical protein U0034_24105 [Trinickia caryophylli]SMF58445.1 hypothetical protein SAMN06295900_11193 [Trinickia caryophylli]GLU33641.1 hypothetical protein Busp01_34830 [Trinickia caryophylli]
MKRHFMSRGGAVAYLLAHCDYLGRESDSAGTETERKRARQEIDSTRQLVLDVRAGRVNMFSKDDVEIVVKV